jgi:hypothetical protein
MLAEIRRTDALASADWLRTFDTATSQPMLSVRESSAAKVDDIATLKPGISFDDEQMLFNGRKWIRALLVLLDEAFAHIRNQKAESRKQKSRSYKTSCKTKRTKTPKPAPCCATATIFASGYSNATALPIPPISSAL